MTKQEEIKVLHETYFVRKEVVYGCTIYSIINSETGCSVNYYPNREEAEQFAKRQNNAAKRRRK